MHVCARAHVSCRWLVQGKTAFPFHYHTATEEAIYVLEGSGTLRQGVEKTASCELVAGDFVKWPAGPAFAHQLVNTSPTDTLRYLCFGGRSRVDICFYPDAGKVGIWARTLGILRCYFERDSVPYFTGEGVEVAGEGVKPAGEADTTAEGGDAK